MSNHNLFFHSADGANRLASNEEILTAARQVLAHRVRRGALLQSPQKVGEYLTMRLGHLDYECFGLILVDGRHRVIECVELFRGTIDGASVYPREIVKLVLEKQAAAVVAYHNHPLCFVRRVTVTANCPDSRRKPLNPSSEIKGNGVLPCFFGSYHAGLPVKALALLTRCARSSTRRVAVQPACDGCVAA
jgi:hypothetical protein